MMGKDKSKAKANSRWRLIVQALSFAFHNGYAQGWLKGEIYTGNNKQFCLPGLNCYSCPGALGSCPIGSLQAVLDSGQYKFSCYVLGFIGLVGMLFGRLICGWLCPFGFVQDLIHKIPLGKKIKNLPGHKYLKYLRYVVLALFVIILPMTVLNVGGLGKPWFCEYICPSGTLFAGIPLVLTHDNLRALIGWRFFWKIALLLIFLIASLVAVRPFCKYICPLGALYGLCNPISVYRLKINEDACIQCGACQQACGMDIKVWETPNSPDCIRCLQCKAVCPNGAITSSIQDFGGKFIQLREDGGLAAKTTDMPSCASCAAGAQGVCSQVVQQDLADKRGKSKRGVYKAAKVIVGLLVIAVSSVYLAYIWAQHVWQLTTSTNYSTFIDYLDGLGLMLPVTIPCIMLLIMGGRLILSVRKASGDAQLKQWALLCLLSIVVAVLLTIGLAAVEACCTHDTQLLVSTLVGFESYGLLYGPSLIGALLSWGVLAWGLKGQKS